MHRRNFIRWITAGSLISGFSLKVHGFQRVPTASQMEGPFYPREPIPLTDSLSQGKHKGVDLLVRGRILDLEGKPIPTARMDVWQCDYRGIYRHPRAPDTRSMDPGFRGFATVLSNQQGEYQFNTIHPVPYTGRPPHIHIMIHVDQSPLLTTQLYLKNKGGPASLQIDPYQVSANALEARYDFVVNHLT